MQDLSVAIKFLQQIGILVVVEPGADGFLPHCRIVEGCLLVDPRCPVSNLLHEAGHLAIIPSIYRAWVSDDIVMGISRMFEDAMGRGLHPDHPLIRAVMQTSDREATAWAWAVGNHLGIAEDKIILDSEYEAGGYVIRAELRQRAYPGINGLAHAGFCSTRIPHGGLPVYPQLAFWLQDARY
jgi:hypothetical protein